MGGRVKRKVLATKWQGQAVRGQVTGPEKVRTPMPQYTNGASPQPAEHVVIAAPSRLPDFGPLDRSIVKDPGLAAPKTGGY
jgi:hypothetical protein